MAITAGSKPATPSSAPPSTGCRSSISGLAAIGKVSRQRETNGTISHETAYYLLSTTLSPVRFAEVVGAHWGIENSLHWVLDVTMNEDQNRSRKDNGPQNIALLRRWALNACRLEGSQGSIKGKLKRGRLE
jgi:predicted transposase YbfD/YdcC